ncbi:FAD-dependent monooxygenase [Gandjariella thermophila]|uniref:FAD-dependent oxidoreductase n=1 Tax=Gandjariella thermophila TaxID=1931992 RepID=A0A4D4JCI7_9PSEU|nr:FAD-dependent monooxygenase [Gandjariella thermophila]GDY33082.1 FAD-dependent oxidoreductase [Gandjariella thermophila]
MTKALIIGAGITGAVTAMALRKAGIEAVIYEAYPTGADDIGAFLTIMPNGLTALRAVEADQVVRDNSFPARSIEVFRGGKQVGARPLGGGADGPRTLKRAGLYRVLHDEAARRGIRLEHGRRLTRAEVTVSGGVVAGFADGSTAEGDLLVGADGIHSTTRTIIDPVAPPPRYTGLNILYGYTRATSFPPASDAYRMIYGRRAFFGYTTAPDGETWWFARLPGAERGKDTTGEQWKRLAIEAFAGDDSPAVDIVRATGDDVIGGNSYDVPSTPNWYRGPLVLAGDAAHAASPAAAQGASMAVEDSIVLAKCLRDLPGVEEAFETYVRLRRNRVERLVAASAEQARNASPGRLRRILRGLRLPAVFNRNRGNPRGWLYDHHIDWDTPVTLGAE